MSLTTKRIVALLSATIIAVLLGMTAGCHDETPVSPNEKTAAPARLPGEDPHAHSIPSPGNRK